MAYFNNKEVRFKPRPIPIQPGVYPPDVPTPEPTESGSTPIVTPPTFSGDTHINIGITTSENIELSKNYNNVFDTDISIKEEVSLINPELIIYTSTDLSKCNYMQFMGKWYYITISLQHNNNWLIRGHIDVLKTYESEIRQHNAIIARNANLYNKYLQDDSFKVYSYKNTRTLKFPSGFNKNLSFVMVSLGGARDE